MIQFLVHEEKDTVGVATEDIKKGTLARGSYMHAEKTAELPALSDIPLGHKIALSGMAVGDDVIEYGHVIGRVVSEIQRGEHVHVHNVKTKRW